MRLLFLGLSSLAYSACSHPNARPNWQQVPVSLDLRLAEGAPAPGLTPAPVYGEGDTVYLHSEEQLSNADIAHVRALNQPEQLVLRLWFTEEGAKRMANVTAGHVQDSLAVLINSVVVAVSIIQEPIHPLPDEPHYLGLHLPSKEASQLAKAVLETWPSPAR